ncbi:hypothetical protein V2W45_1464204 [Cenococcum geophilum]
MLLVVYTYTRRAKDLLRFNPTILISDGKRYIKVRFILNKPIKRARYIAVYCKGDTSKIPLRKEEGELLRKVIGKEVVNVARYYHHKTVYIGSKEDNIYKNVRKGLDIIKATNYKPEDLIMPLRPARVKISIRKGRSSSRNRSFSRKRSFSYTNAPLPPSKRIYSGSPPLGKRRPITLNRPLYKPAFLINFNLAIKEQQKGPLGARGKTSTRAFMAIRVLLGEIHLT